MKKENNIGSNAIKYSKHIFNTSKNSKTYSSVKLSANFLKKFGLSAFQKPSLSASLILMRLTRYVDVDFKIQTTWDTLYTEMGMRSDIFDSAKSNLIKHGFVVKKFDGYYVTDKTHVLISNLSDALYVPNHELLSDYNKLRCLKQKQVSFLYFLIGKTVSLKTKYIRKYDLCSLYENKYSDKEKIGFDLFKSIKELLEAITVMASLGLIEAEFIHKKGKVIENELSTLNKDSLKDTNCNTAVKKLLTLLGYTYNEQLKLIKNPSVKDYKIKIKLLLDDKEYMNTANFEEFKNELSVYNLDVDNVFDYNNTLNQENNAINLFIAVKKQLINSIGTTLGTKIFRDALRYFLSEKHDRLYAYNVVGIGKAVNIFKKFYLMPYLKKIMLNIAERIKLEGEGALISSNINVADYNTSITHGELNAMVDFITNNADLTIYVETLNTLSKNTSLLKQLNSHYPAFSEMNRLYKKEVNKLYEKYVKNRNIKMTLQTFEDEVLIDMVGILDRHTNESFENVLDKFIQTYQDVISFENVQTEIEKYHHHIASLHKTFIKSQIEYAVDGYSDKYRKYAPGILREIYKELIDNVPLEKFMNLSREQHNLIIERAKVLFEATLQAKINRQTQTVSFYDWLTERE